MVTRAIRTSRIAPFILTAFFATLIVGCANVKIHIKNDTGTYVRIANCVDDSADIEPGETFDVGGVPSHGELLCTVSPNQEHTHCVAIPNAQAVHGTFLLSHAIRVPKSRCG
jgi:hypothetical protein